MKININTQAKKWFSFKEKTYTKPFKTRDALPMNLGECLFPIKSLEKSLLKVDFSVARTYPTQFQDVKQKLAEVFSVKENMIALGNGSDEIIENIPRVFLNPGDDVLVVIPTFFRFIEASEKAGAKIHIVKTRLTENFRITEEVVKKIIRIAKEKNVKIIWLCSPNNPTGIPILPKHIEKIAKSTNSLIVLDNIYAELQEDSFLHPKDIIRKFPNIVILKSFSKVFGLAGLRVGFAIANKKIIQKLERWNMPFHISSISLEIARNILLKRNVITSKMKKIVTKERQFLIKQLRKIDDVDIIVGSQTNLILFRHKTKNIFLELLKRNILIADFNNAKGIENLQFARVSVGTRQQNIHLIQALQEICNFSFSDSERIRPSENQ